MCFTLVYNYILFLILTALSSSKNSTLSTKHSKTMLDIFHLLDIHKLICGDCRTYVDETRLSALVTSQLGNLCGMIKSYELIVSNVKTVNTMYPSPNNNNCFPSFILTFSQPEDKIQKLPGHFLSLHLSIYFITASPRHILTYSHAQTIQFSISCEKKYYSLL